MRVVIFTSSAVRHQYFVNRITTHSSAVLWVAQPQNQIQESDEWQMDHWSERDRTECEMMIYPFYEWPRLYTLTLSSREALNSMETYALVKQFNPQVALAFGGTIIKEPMLSGLSIPFLNLHLGIAPYYRGAGTNFWPFVNNELEHVGATIMKIAAGVDTGEVVEYVYPDWTEDDNVHTAGCKTIMRATDQIIKILGRLGNHMGIPCKTQKEIEGGRYYRKIDFTQDALGRYHANMRAGIVKEFVQARKGLQTSGVQETNQGRG